MCYYYDSQLAKIIKSMDIEEIDNNQKNQEKKREPEKNAQEIRQQRLATINSELENFQNASGNYEDINKISSQKEQEFQDIIKNLEIKPDQPLSQESVTMIHKNIVDSAIQQVHTGNEYLDKLNIKKTILENLDNNDFKKKISPTKAENLTENVFDKALEKLLTADIDLPKNERIKLFRQTLEYYAKKQPTAESPVWHSTSSYSLRKGLEEGFSGGKISGGENAKQESVGKPLSITHPDFLTAEDFQEMFARLCAKGSESLTVDSEKITGDSLPKIFFESFSKQLTNDEKKEFMAKRLNLDSASNAVNNETDKIYKEYENKYGAGGENIAKEYLQTKEASERLEEAGKKALKITPDKITEEMINKTISPEAMRVAINDFEKRSYVPPVEKIEQEILPTIKDEKLREELRSEAHFPFPCMITFELKGKEEQAHSIMKGETPTHIPFEDHFYGTFNSNDIKEIRVPLNKVEKTKDWSTQKGLTDVEIVPMELYEVKRIIDNCI